MELIGRLFVLHDISSFMKCFSVESEIVNVFDYFTVELSNFHFIKTIWMWMKELHHK
jgi:hypothetical protein